ncbi:MAG: hypothetical protein M3463_04225 [Verrucomicrobiota bacterium]|nr:hypothetical protein [Verrucomicrobiota bacterium]
MKLSPLVLTGLAACTLAVHALELSDAELEAIGRRVWQNECAGTRDGLTSWNAGENFASLGIGHFIWYPKGVDGPFEESFPRLAAFLSARGTKVPAWLRGDCVWSSRAEFQAEFRGARMNELRDLLASTILLQSRFLAERLEAALPKMLDAAPAGQREQMRGQFERLSSTGAGMFALIDYVNFKGEGTNPKERYNGEGWGLLQVLAGMKGSGKPEAAREFARSAESVLTRRVKNAPAERNEQRWLAGWTKRVRSYGD